MNKHLWTLRQKIYIFAGSVMLMIILIGSLFILTSQKTIQSYQQIMLQITSLQQIKTKTNEMSEIVRRRIVNGEDNISECMTAWENLKLQIDELNFDEDSSIQLLISDLQTYHQHTRKNFFQLIQNYPQQDAETLDANEQYQIFITQQDDRQFLCDQLLKLISSYISDNYDSIMRQYTMSWLLFAMLLICLVLLTGSFSMTLAESINQPISRLIGQTRELMHGNYQMNDLPVLQCDEIGQLTAAFNVMKKKIQENFQTQEKLWELELMLQDAELRALQSQVNPHFLYNVLCVATESALMENADHTVDIIENISRMLHYSLTSVREESWLSDELQMVQSYIFLQTERFGKRISFFYEVPKEIPALRTPGMTVQPILENAIKHGVEQMNSGGIIRVFMQQTEKSVTLCVEDNGCGIPKEKVDQLNRGEIIQRSEHSTGLGIVNVYSRMKAFYKRDGLLRIESSEGSGTRVYLQYLKEGEKADVPGSDYR